MLLVVVVVVVVIADECEATLRKKERSMHAYRNMLFLPNLPLSVQVQALD